MILLIGLVPGRPKHERQRTVSPNDIEVAHGKILFSPVTGRSDDGLVFAHHLLKILDCLKRDVILLVAKIHECTGISALLGNHYLDRFVRIDLRDNHASTAPD